MKLKFSKSKITRGVKQVSNYPHTNFHLNFFDKTGRASISLQKKAGTNKESWFLTWQNELIKLPACNHVNYLA